MKFICIKLLLLFISSGLVINQTLQHVKAKEYWINLPSSPVKIIQNSKGTTLVAINYSQGQVTNYRLGWVTEDKNKIIVKCILPMQQVNIAPMDLSNKESHFVGLTSVEKVEEYSLKNNTKLAIIEVNFSDGSIWKASKTISEGQPLHPTS